MSAYSSEHHVLKVYHDFLINLHSVEPWPYDFSFLKNEENCQKNELVTPLLMTEGKAASEGVWWYSQLKDVFSAGKKQGIIKDLIVHGSHGDFSTTEFSDLEVTVLIDESVFFSCNKKNKLSVWVKGSLNKLIVKVDPLQHHGAFFVWEDLLRNYSNSILPVCAYHTCWSVTGQSLQFNSVSDVDCVAVESLRRLKSTLYRISDPRKYFFRFGYNEYSVKRYLSNIMLIPAFYYQSKGFIFNKRESIEKFLEERSGLFSEAILMATEIRYEWPKPPRLLKLVRPWFVSTKIPQGKHDIILLSMFSDRPIIDKTKSKVTPIAKAGALELLGEINGNN